MSLISRASGMNLTKLENIKVLSKNIIRILGCNPSQMTLQGTNSYILHTPSSNRCTLIDTSNPQIPEYIQNLRSVLTSKKLKISNILITHWHIDHIGAVSDILGTDLITDDIKVAKFGSGEGYPFPMKKLKQEKIIVNNELNLRVLHTPGHTHDHMAIHFENNNALFVGDLVLGEGTTTVENMSDYMKSLEEVKELESVILYPGHGPIIKTPGATLLNYIEHRNAREKQILTLLEDYPEKFVPVSFITKQIYQGIPSSLFSAAMNNVECHLEKLEEEQEVTKNEENRYTKKL